MTDEPSHYQKRTTKDLEDLKAKLEARLINHRRKRDEVTAYRLELLDFIDERNEQLEDVLAELERRA